MCTLSSQLDATFAKLCANLKPGHNSASSLANYQMYRMAKQQTQVARLNDDGLVVRHGVFGTNTRTILLS